MDASLAEDEESCTVKREEDPGSHTVTRRARGGAQRPQLGDAAALVRPLRAGPSLPPLPRLPGIALPEIAGPPALRTGVSRTRDHEWGLDVVRPGSFPVHTVGIQLFSSPVRLLPQALGPFSTSARTSARNPLALLYWASQLPTMNLRFRVCKVGASVHTSRGCGEAEGVQ